jgi:hypothetical protein
MEAELIALYASTVEVLDGLAYYRETFVGNTYEL